MRHEIISLVQLSIRVLATIQTLAQQTTDAEKTEQLRKANRKVVIGLALIGAGALAAPLTAITRHDGDPSGRSMQVGVGMMFLGSGVTWWGVSQRSRALQPQTAIGIAAGRSIGLHFRRTW